MFSKEVIEVAQRIGQFYLEKNHGDYEKTKVEILSLLITSVEVTEGKVIIKTSRPGLLIGKRGINIDNISTFLDKKIHVLEERENIVDCITPRPEPVYDMYGCQLEDYPDEYYID